MPKCLENGQKQPKMPWKLPNLHYVPNFGTNSEHFLKIWISGQCHEFRDKGIHCFGDPGGVAILFPEDHWISGEIVSRISATCLKAFRSTSSW